MRVLPFLRFDLAAVAPTLAIAFAACTTSPYYDYRFDPAPQEVQVSDNSLPSAQARALVTVLGIEREREGQKARVLIRVRLENIGSTTASFVPESLSLLTADLQPFEPASVHPPEIKILGAGESATYDCCFPLPGDKKPSDLDLGGLNVRFDVAFETSRVPIGMTFQRTDWEYYYDEPRVHVGFGVGIHHVH